MAATVDTPEVSAGEPYPAGLLPALRRLDNLIQQALNAAQAAYGPEAAADPFRGLHITSAEVKRLLEREPGAPVLYHNGAETSEAIDRDGEEADARLVWLAQAFGLSAFDMDIIVIALAPEIDLRYERLYAYLQDDVSRRRPSVDMALNLLCRSAEDKLARRAHFAADAPLIRQGLMHLIPDPSQIQPPLLAHFLKLDEQIVDVLLGQAGLDRRLVPFCDLIRPALALDDLLLLDEDQGALTAMVEQARATHQPLRLYFQGVDRVEQRRAAEAIACTVGAPLLIANLAHVPIAAMERASIITVLLREAWFQDAILYLDDLDALRAPEHLQPYRRLMQALVKDAGVTILAGGQAWQAPAEGPVGVLPIRFLMPDANQRRQHWRAALATTGTSMPAHDLAVLAERFQRHSGHITEAAATAHQIAQRRSLGTIAGSCDDLSAQLSLDDLFVAARAQCGHDLAALAHKIVPIYAWDDIVLPADALAQLREMCGRVAHRHDVLGAWGFDRKLAQGKGVNALFAGPSGTGKTMAAEIIANELGLDVYKIDLAGVVSKYIGETEKNLDRIFAAAESANAILFFDEADALFGKRSEVRDSHDRYANIEISYLLQKIEVYEGVSILATNLRQNLDESFVRRLAFTVHFPFPDEAHRRRIWAGIWPRETPLADDVDLDLLARQFKLSGGNIKNIALAAAFLATDDGGLVTMAHLLHATRREYQKLGKVLSDAELSGARGDMQAAK